MDDRLTCLDAGDDAASDASEGTSEAERRVPHRARTRLPARWDRHRLAAQPGEVRNLSTTGMFLRPAGGTVRFREHDAVWGSFSSDGDAETRTFRAVVRWRGWSMQHRCVGLGLEFTSDCQLSDSELREICWPTNGEGRPVLRLVRTTRVK